MLICRCAGCEALSESRRGVLDEIARNRPCAVVDDLCGLVERRDGMLAQWARQPGLIVLACQERAVRALFAYAGCELPADCTVVNVRQMSEEELRRTSFTAESSGATPKHFPLGGADSGENQLAAPPNERRLGVAPSHEAISTDSWAPWYPVIDYSRCVHCRQCVGFCLFGVYAVEDGKVRVANPRNCKPQCPACARVCPKSAIIFPKYPSGVVSGADPDTTPPDPAERFDLSAMNEPELIERLRKRLEGGHEQ